MRNDLREARSQEIELRYMLQQYISGEKQMKGELQQLKLKQEQNENKLVLTPSIYEALIQNKISFSYFRKARSFKTIFFSGLQT